MLSFLLNPVFLPGWIVLSFICGVIGSSRRTGFWGSFLLALVVSPVLVFIALKVFKPTDAQ